MEDLKLTNPDKILYPEQGITKLELAKFYINIKNWILPYIKNRPLTLVRCPEGHTVHCFYQKHLHENIPHGLLTIPIKEKKKLEDYIYLNELKGLIALVQMGVLEIHPWGARIDNVEKPDMITFDLDPGHGVTWKAVITAAHHVREQLENLSLTSFVKTTGGKGLHVVVPIKRSYDWDTVKAFTRAVVDFIVQQKPDEFIGTMSKTKRVGKIYLDYLRNQRGATAIAAYSTRARAGAPVSVPLHWDELTVRIHSDSFNIRNLPARLAKLKKDPWEGFFSLHQSLKGL